MRVVDLEACSNDRGVRSELALPDAVAHHRNQWRSFVVVGIGHQPSNPWLHTQRAKEIPRNVLPVARIRLGLRSGTPYPQRRIASLERCEVNELRSMRAEVLVCLP